MRYVRWKKLYMRKMTDGEIRAYWEPSGRFTKFDFYPADGSRKQTQILEGDGEVAFLVPGKNRSVRTRFETLPVRQGVPEKVEAL